MDLSDKHFVLPASELIQLVVSSGQRSSELYSDLAREQFRVPLLDILNPFLWEIGHVAFFYEANVLRHTGFDRVLMKDGKQFYDSMEVEHHARWTLPLPSHDATLEYVQTIEKHVVDRLAESAPDARSTYLHLLAVQHEDMHAEAFTYMRQTLGYPAPKLSHVTESRAPRASDAGGDLEFEGGAFLMGAEPSDHFVYGNEKWAHPVEVAPFQVARTTVSAGEYLQFVEGDGYRRRELWSDEGWSWRQKSELEHPIYWKRESNGNWLRRAFDRWIALEVNLPVVNVTWHEARAFCEWAGRRLPTEVEWNFAAANASDSHEHANIDWQHGGVVATGSFKNSNSDLHHLIGNVWEWTSTSFEPFPGYVIDEPYRDYSAPWFGPPKVLKGGSWATPPRLANKSFRNFFLPDRNDVFAGFRTCAR